MSKYQTRRQQRRSRIRNIIKRTVLIIVLAAVAVVSTFYYVGYKYQNQTSFSSLRAKLKGQQPTKAIKDSPQILAENYSKSEIPAQLQTPDTTKSIQPVVQQFEQPAEKLMDNSAFNHQEPTAETITLNQKSLAEGGKQPQLTTKVVKPVKATPGDTLESTTVVTPAGKAGLKELSPQKMSEILSSIQSEKIKSNNRSNCIQIQKTNTSNVSNAFAIAKFLNSNGFIISGRLTIPGDQEGIHIDAFGSCIKLTIGSL